MNEEVDKKVLPQVMIGGGGRTKRDTMEVMNIMELILMGAVESVVGREAAGAG